MNIKINFALILMFVFVCINQTNLLAQTSLADALKRATDTALRGVEKNQRIAIVHVASPSKEVYDLVLDEMQSILVGSGFRVMNRNPIREILADFQIGVSDEIDDTVAVNIGTHVEADLVLIGIIEQDRSRFRLRVLDKNSDTVGIATEYFSVHSISNHASSISASGTGWMDWIQRNASGVSAATVLREGTLTQKFAQLQRTVDSHGVYVLEVNANERINSQTFVYAGAINVYIVLVGVGGNRTINLQTHGNMLIIPANITFIIDNNITLQGHRDNNAAVVQVNGGNFVMLNGSAITGNHTTGQGTAGLIINGGSFYMNGGSITNNRSVVGGAIRIAGGVFTMNGGTISNNSATEAGGGVNLNNGIFNMRGGMISNNSARRNGGGVNVMGGTFNKTGGTITGSDHENGNRVQDDSGTIARRGHAVWVNENRRRETTSSPNNNLNSGNNTGWN